MFEHFSSLLRKKKTVKSHRNLFFFGAEIKFVLSLFFFAILLVKFIMIYFQEAKN